MTSQNNTGRQYDKRHAVTVVATAVLSAYRFVAYDGGYPTTAGGAKDVQGVSEHQAMVGEAVSVVTGYSYLMEVAEPIAFGTLVKPDPMGKAAVGTSIDHAGRALGAATTAGQLIEVKLLRHSHA